jgi:NADH:ubiquinone oxidoreductase subunit 6 (subunit J)
MLCARRAQAVGPSPWREKEGNKKKQSMQISVQTLLLDLSAIPCIIPAVAVATRHNPIHSVVSPTPVSRNAAGSLVLSGTEFIAMMFLTIHAGAIAVPFPFAVTMPNTKVAPEGGHKVTAGHMGSWWDNKPGTAWVVAKPYFALVALVVCFVSFFGLA